MSTQTMTRDAILEDCIARCERIETRLDEWLCRWDATGYGGGECAFCERRAQPKTHVIN